MLEGTPRRHRNSNSISSLADIAATIATTAAMADLRDATRLIEELSSKLIDLDSKVAAYRLDMASEFTRHSEELLRTVPEDVAYRVSRAIADQIANYPHLYPPGSVSSSRSATPTNPEDISWRGKGSPPPAVQQVSASSQAAASAAETSRQRDSHEREQEFQGLFTPTYLPLLESVDRPLHSPPALPSTADTATIDRRLSAGDAQISNSSASRHRPSPLRCATDTSVDSLASDSSSAKTRKSALRRSSGSSKADSPRDPRRVRFEFSGQEVLPSSSPQSFANSLNEVQVVQEETTIADEPYSTSLGDVEGEEDLRDEKPKKVSSSQALRALSKAPLDQETIWTVVNPGAGSEDSLDADKNRKPSSPIPMAQPIPVKDAMTINTLTPQPEHGNGVQAEIQDKAKKDARGGALTSVPEPSEAIEEAGAGAEEEDSEEEMMFMTSKRSNSKTRTTPVQNKMPLETVPETSATPVAFDRRPTSLKSQAVSTNRSSDTTTGTLSTVHGADTKQHGATENNVRNADRDGDDDEDFFDFDDDNEKPGSVAHAASRPTKKYLPEPVEEDEGEDRRPRRPDMNMTKALDEVASSPLVNIPARPGNEKSIPNESTHQPESARAFSTSIGSFVDRDGRKRSLTPGPVKDPELLKKLENLDIERPFFVGSVNGNSGVDASNVKSYQASLMSPTQTSGSFAERLMWEKSQGILYDSDNDELKVQQKGRR